MSAEKDFVQKVLTHDNVVETIQANMNVLIEIIPEIRAMIGFEHKHPHHHLDVWQHTLYALSLAPNDFDVRLSLLLHDIGKPTSFQEVDGVRHFKGHPEVSSKIVHSILTRLGFDDDYCKYICQIIALHDTPLTKEYLAANYSLSGKIFEVQKCDALAHNPTYNKNRLKYIEDTQQLFNQQENNS